MQSAPDTIAGSPARWRFGESIAAPAAVIARGGVLAIPTESSYGLAVDPRSRAGVAAVFRIKGRPASKPLPVVAADPIQLTELGLDPTDPTFRAIRPVWPAAVTAVVSLMPGIRLAAAGGTATGERASLAIRVPALGRLRALLSGLGPLSATSANRAGDTPILDPQALETLLAGEDAMIVDAGILRGGPPSTLVRMNEVGWQILREGAFPIADLPSLDRSTHEGQKP